MYRERGRRYEHDGIAFDTGIGKLFHRIEQD